MRTSSNPGSRTDLVELEEKDLMPGDVAIAVDYSTVNYKDGVALTGRAPVIRKFPLIPGIDLAGTVEASSNPGFEVGDKVVVNGWGLSQTHHGGYVQRAQLKRRLARQDSSAVLDLGHNGNWNSGI